MVEFRFQCCLSDIFYLVSESTFHLVWLGRPYQEFTIFSEHSYPSQWGTQSSYHVKVTAHGWHFLFIQQQNMEHVDY